MSRALPGLVALCVLGTVLAGSTWGAPLPGVFLVGYDPKDADSARLAIQASGGSVRRASPELGFAVVDAADGDAFQRLARASPFIQYVETDDVTGMTGAQWNGAQWNGAQWNGAQWNGAQWNGAQWNTLRNEDPAWGEAQRSAHAWTILHAPSKWSYDTGSTDPGLVWQWGTWAIQAPTAWQTSKGSGATTLCVLDSGVAWDHPDIKPNYGAGWNAIDPSRSAYDDAGHGTHIAGIAAARVGNAWGVAGVANAKILAVKVLDANGRGHESDLAFGLAWCAAQGADVAVMALSVTEADHPTLDRALQFAAQRDVLLLASAGNDGPCVECVAYPARDSRVVAVSALDGNGRLAAFSNQGSDVEIAAPGVAVLGPFPGNAFVFGSGTSQAVAYAAGMAVLVRDANPALSAPQVRDLLHATAVDVSLEGRDPATGYGLVNANHALRLALAS
ncbi:MAG TPA: S8 family serine peptidase [Candidatus Thermoplasmatota archaeon]|nr:S8 family serine peptidase [Candidatus Thermoplasmatota archaeon]